MASALDPINTREEESQARSNATKATALFALLVLFWLIVSNLIFGTRDYWGEHLSWKEIIEGLLYVLGSALMFFFLFQNTNKKTLGLIHHYAEENRFNTNALDASGTGIWSWDLASGEVVWNAGCGQLLGYDSSLKKPNYRSWYNKVFPADRPYAERQIKAATDGQKPVTFEYRRVLPTGDTRWTMTTARAIRDDSGKAVVLTGIMRDIQPRKQAEEERLDEERNKQRIMSMALCAIANEVEQREPYRALHLQRVAVLAVALGRKLGMPPEAQEGLRMGAYLHDIGKIKIPASILNRKGPLSLEEQALLQTHPQRGMEIFKGIVFPWPLQQMILQHQERLDGSGYPHHYQGEQIVLEARILAVADVVEAMASHRPHRPAPGLKAALEEIYQRRGIMYDERVVMACIGLFTKDGFTLPRAPQSQTPPG